MKVVIVSGFFNPLHGGHLDMIEAARELGDRLIVIVNNDKQQILKKGKIILEESNRARLIRSLKPVDEVVFAIDNDPPVIKTLEKIAHEYENDELIFANGGDRDGHRNVPESDMCKKHGIEMVFGVGSHEIVKRDSSTRINQELGLQEKDD
jgi:cytidyltransferase-like protein